MDLTSSQDFALDLGGLPGLDPGTTEVVLDETPCQVDADCTGGLTCHEGSCAVVLGVDETANFQVTFVPDEINPIGDDGQPIVALYTSTCGGHTEDGKEIAQRLRRADTKQEMEDVFDGDRVRMRKPARV